MSTTDVRPPGAIGVWGAFDVDALGAQLRMRVVVSELQRRRPDLAVRAFAPLGGQRPFAADSSEPLESLESLDAGQRKLADALALVVVSIDLGDLGDKHKSVTERLLRGPGAPARVVWHALGVPQAFTPPKDAIAVDRISWLRNTSARAWAIASGSPPVTETAHPALLAPTLFTPELLAARLEFLRAVDAWPDDARPILVQGAAGTPTAPLAALLGARPVVALVADAAAGDGDFADAIVAALPGAQRLPANAGTEDRVAAIAGAAGVIATSPVVLDVARAFGVPHASMEAVGSSNLEDILIAPASADGDVREIHDELDAIAGLAPGPGPSPLAWSELAATRAALEARARRMTAERVAMADAVLADRERVAELERQVAALEAAYQDVRNLEVVRLRVALGDLRTRLHLRRKR